MSTTNAHISTRRHRSRIVTGWLTITAMLLMTVTSCQRQEYLEGDIELTFSSDTVAFDTVFTTMGTATKYVKVYNNYDDPLLLRSVTLEQGANSRFRLNVDGDTSLVARNVEIAPHDSMFILSLTGSAAVKSYCLRLMAATLSITSPTMWLTMHKATPTPIASSTANNGTTNYPMWSMAMP